MRLNKVIGWFLIIGAVGVLIPYTILTITLNILIFFVKTLVKY